MISLKSASDVMRSGNALRVKNVKYGVPFCKMSLSILFAAI